MRRRSGAGGAFVERAVTLRAGVVIFVAALAACGDPAPAPTATLLPTSGPSVPVAASPMPAPAAELWTDVEARVEGDAKRGEGLVAHYECVRCHAGTGQPAPFIDRQCVGCHRRVMAGTLPFPAARLETWKASLHHYVTTPDLAQAGKTLRRSWLTSFLEEPTKVRPHMSEWMPRLGIPEKDAADIAAYLTRDAAPADAHPSLGDAKRGESVARDNGCFNCHELTGKSLATDVTVKVPPSALGEAYVRAPDLRLTRDRFRPDLLAQWIEDPAKVHPGALMPTLGLSKDDARDVAAYVLTAPLADPPAAPPPFTRLPVLTRRVTYEEVSEKVFKKGCIHCHADPDDKGSDPGPGSAGGFGFAARGVRLTSYAGFALGYRTKGGARRSLVTPEPALESRGGSRLVAALVARHEETSGRPIAEVRGMPLGLPGLSAEDVQLVETWVAEGAPLR